MEEEKERKSRVGFGILCQRFLLRYRLSNTKVIALLAIVAIIGLTISILPNEIPSTRTGTKESVSDDSVDFSSKEKGLLKLERELEEKNSELRLKEQELRELELLLREKEQFINDKMNSKDKEVFEEQVEKKTGSIDLEKRNAVKEAFLFAWNGYKTKCWGQDELKPVDGQAQNWMGLGLTIVDSLDTLWIMDLKDEFKEAKSWIQEHLNFNIHRSVSFFETTIRVMGGLLSAYELSKDSVFLNKADELGTRFLPAFDTPSGLPRTTINLATGASSNPSWAGGSGILSEMATVQMEFTYLAHHTGKSIYKDKSMKVFDILNDIPKHSGLYSIYVNTDSPHFTRKHITLGAMGDSFYEYLLKIWILSGKKWDKYRVMYDEAADNIIDKLVKKSSPSNLVYIAELIDDRVVNKMDHLVCFAGAMYALGAQGDTKEKHFEVGEGITKTCYEFYKRTSTGISGELVHFNPGNDFVFPHDARHYLLRPETVESMFVLWRLTHDPIYRQMGWEIFQAIDKYCKTTYGYSGIRDVTNINPSFDNLQQSFFLAETLKYLYLLFSEDELIPLDKYVFNTEAHPLGILHDIE